MTAPIIPTDLDYPVRGEDRTVFATKANTFNQRLVDEFAPRQNELGVWMNQQAVASNNILTQTTTQANNAAVSAANASLSESNAASSAANASGSLQTVLDAQVQANALLGAGIGTTYLQDGDLYITYVEATVNNVSINQDGLLIVETI